MSEQKKKIYCFNNGGPSDWLQAVAIAEDGTCIAGHICSAESFMPHDLGITSDWKHDDYNEHYGEGNWELEWVPTAAVRAKSHEGLQSALRLNEQLREKAEVSQR